MPWINTHTVVDHCVHNLIDNRLSVIGTYTYWIYNKVLFLASFLHACSEVYAIQGVFRTVLIVKWVWAVSVLYLAASMPRAFSTSAVWLDVVFVPATPIVAITARRSLPSTSSLYLDPSFPSSTWMMARVTDEMPCMDKLKKVYCIDFWNLVSRNIQ